MLSSNRLHQLILAIFLTLLLVVATLSEKNHNFISYNFISYKDIDWANDPSEFRIQITGNVNISNFLLEHRPPLQQNKLYRLDIINSSIEEISEKTVQFHGLKVVSIYIENAPNLRHIQRGSLAEIKDHLRYFRAINTSLPQYNDLDNDDTEKENPFDGLINLHQVYILDRQSQCPSETLLFPCKCTFGNLGDWSAPYGFETREPIASTTHIICDRKNVTEVDLKNIFAKISSSEHEPKRFDVFRLTSAPRFTAIPRNFFSNVSMTTVSFEGVANLKSIHPEAFFSESNDFNASTIQVLEIEGANFGDASPVEVDNIFRAFSSLRNIRYLGVTDCGIPYIPPFAFVPENRQRQLNNLLSVNLQYSRIKSVGSFAFSGAPNLVYLDLARNSISKFDSFAFAFNQTSNRTLNINVGANPFNTTHGLKPNAFSGSLRPVQIRVGVQEISTDLERKPLIDSMPEDVFRPFFEEHPNNSFIVGYFNVDVWCDCKSRWMFDDVGNLKRLVQNGFRMIKYSNAELSKPYSFQCKSESSFECLPNCLTFPAAGLIHCGGTQPFDIKSTFHKLAQLHDAKHFPNLRYSTKEMQELPMDAFESFPFTRISLDGCWNLTTIHPNAFRASTHTLKTFTAKNTNLTYYPNFANFPELDNIQFDDFKPFHINSSNFDFTDAANRHPKEIHIFMNDGTADPETFSRLNGETTLDLNIGEWNDSAANVNDIRKCKPSKIQLDAKTFKTFLKANPKNKIKINCYLECSCELQWIKESWNHAEQSIASRIAIWSTRYYADGWTARRWPPKPTRGKFYCALKGIVPEANLHDCDMAQFQHDKFFAENCSG